MDLWIKKFKHIKGLVMALTEKSLCLHFYYFSFIHARVRSSLKDSVLFCESILFLLTVVSCMGRVIKSDFQK